MMGNPSAGPVASSRASKQAALEVALLALVLLLGAVVGGQKFIGRRGRVFCSPAAIILAIFGVWGGALSGLFCSIELNVKRLNYFYLPCVVLAVWVTTLIANSFLPSVLRPSLRLVVVGWLLLEGDLAVVHYFIEYRTGPIKLQFNNGLGEAFAMGEGMRGINQLRIIGLLPLPCVSTLFYLRYPPVWFQREVREQLQEGSYRVYRFGQ
ncbi:hypothetical protein QMK33_03840 [Hymenobacter sp. H14-R3]|uniref:hypothetical protein n=1 Tax=Hymenobacter sp. H14-R3 TaxID=3046308 RepID=UPI0024BBBF45|nr:hypothetical protein [Hymenobacter sp. H14-R3]MDJ0364269.1 hypothetical protein [Hymenobacter sp. H14-R3]